MAEFGTIVEDEPSVVEFGTVVSDAEPEPIKPDRPVVEFGTILDDEPTTGEVIKGVGAEMGASVAGSIAGGVIGGAIGSVVPVIGTAIGATAGTALGGFTGGVLGSLWAQNIEDQEDFSVGRALGAGVVSAIPLGGTAAKGVKGAAKIGAATIGKAAGREAVKGAALGTTEATIRTVVDEGRLPTKEELATYAGAGAVFGGALGAVTPKISKTLDGLWGKSIDEVDNALIDGKVDLSKLTYTLKEGGMTEGALRKEVQDMAVRKQSKEVATELEKAVALGKTSKGVIGKIQAAIMPSRFIGERANQAAINYKRSVIEAEEIGSRLARNVQRHIDKDPELNNTVNRLLDGEPMAMDQQTYERVGADIEKYREARTELQKNLVNLLDDDAYRSLSPEAKASLKNAVQDSLDGKAYNRREYKIFLDKDYKPDSKLEEAAFSELAAKMGDVKAREHMNNLLNASARTRDADPRTFFAGGVDSILKRKHNPGDMERAWLGEVVEAPERMRGTLSGLGKSVARAKADMEIGRNLEAAGLAARHQAGDLEQLVLRGTGPEGTGLFVTPEVQSALNQIYLPEADQKTSNIIVNGLQDLYRASVAGSKASKVLLNTVAYPVQLYGNTISLVGMGINPFKGAARGLDLAFSEFGGIERLKKTPAARKALLDEIQDMNRYGIKGANIIDSDLRNTLDNGIFSKVLNKVTDPVGKLYSVPDTMGRYVGWKANQQTLRKIFPSASEETIKRQAAHMINDTYQNYDKLSNLVRTLSRWGVMPQFASFTSEFMRNQYNQGKIIARMMRGDYGSEFAQELGEANVKRMRMEATKRLASLTAVYGTTAGAIEGVKAASGVDEKTEEALRDVSYAPWEKNASPMVSLSKDKKTGWTANMSYISPHAMGWAALQAGLDGDSEASLAGMLAEEFVGDGSFIMQEAMRALENRSKSGKPITNELDDLKSARDRMKYFITESFRPGFARELDKFKDAKMGRGDITLKDVGQRQLGIRKNLFDVDKNARFTMQRNNEAGKAAASQYKSLLKFESPTPEEALSAYEDANRLHKESVDALIKNRDSLRQLDRTDDEIIGLMKGARVSSRTILDVMDGNTSNLPRALAKSTSDMYDELPTDPQAKLSAIRNILKTDTESGKRLLNAYKAERTEGQRGLTQRDLLYKRMNTLDKVDYLSRNPSQIQDFRRKNLLNDSVINALRLKGVL